MPSLRKVNGRYFLYFYDKHRTPKQKGVALGTSLKSAAQSKARDLERRWLDPHDPFDPWKAQTPADSGTTFQEAASAFLASRSHLREASLRTYADVLRWLGERLPPGLRIRDLPEGKLKAFVHDASVSKASQHKRYTHVRAFLKWCVKAGLLDESPLEGVQKPKNGRKVPLFLTADDAERLLTAIRTDYEMKLAASQAQPGQILWLADAVELALATGMRRGELLALRWRDVDLVTGTIAVRASEGFDTKSGSERSLPMTKPARAVLERLQAARTDGLDGYVLTGENGGPLYPNLVTRRFKHYVRLAKVDERLKFHSLRHTTASWLAMRGHSLQIIAAILGHSSTSVTQIYAHLMPDTLRRAMLDTFDSFGE